MEGDKLGCLEEMNYAIFDYTKGKKEIMILYVLETNLKFIKCWFNERRGFKHGLRFLEC